jgi:hypothetical protein
MRFLRFGFLAFTVVFLLTILFVGQSLGRGSFDPNEIKLRPYKLTSDFPAMAEAAHTVGRIGLAVTNYGVFGAGDGFVRGSGNDVFTGKAIPSCEYPYPGRLDYLYAGAFWIGAVVGRDTLVSVGADGWLGTQEMAPDPSPKGDFEYHTMRDLTDDKAVSEQDYICMYTDTVTNPSYVNNDPIDGRPHIPIGIEVTQRSYSWSYSYAWDFVLFDYSIQNINTKKTLEKVYMGIYVDADVATKGYSEGSADDICGFKFDMPSPVFDPTCNFIDTVRIAWIADNDGKDKEEDPCPYSDNGSPTSVTGTRIVRTPSDSLKYSFNWWISNGDASQDFGPRKAGTIEDPFRSFGGNFLGTPMGDKNKYYIMSHEEFDYDQLFSAKDNTADGWLPKSSLANTFADGFDTRYLLSFGPFNIDPGEVLPISFAYVAGMAFHTNCKALEDIFNPGFPEDYYNQLTFDSLGKNAAWAAWIYDNPGVDTDGDGYAGKYRLCIRDSALVDTLIGDPPKDTTIVVYLDVDTLFYEGDGSPDFRGASPPPPPILRVFPSVNEYNEGELKLRFNGKPSETTKDPFSGLFDFEGYNVFMSQSDRTTDFIKIDSYDKHDYIKFIYYRSRNIYSVKDIPFSIDSLKKLYENEGGSDFNPLDYDIDYPFHWKDSIFYFTRQGWNVDFSNDGIHKVYPTAEYPRTLIIDTALKYYPEDLIPGDTLLKYFEYEYTIKHLLPSPLYYVAVTAFDFGSPSGGISYLENSPRDNMVAEYAQNNSYMVDSFGLKVSVYPNPYRTDGNYKSIGFEGHSSEDQNKEKDRIRKVHFMNLPNKCTIRIFSIDGDLVKEINHDMPKDAPTSAHDSWDLITKNTQAAVSGIYYWSVESDKGSQIGKLVLIM